jgi:hypothetical protein
MDNEVAGVLRGVPLHSVVEEIVALGRVVDLVEDLARRVTQADQPEHAGEDGDGGGADPGERTVVREPRGEPSPYDLGDRNACRVTDPGRQVGRVGDGCRAHRTIVGARPGVRRPSAPQVSLCGFAGDLEVRKRGERRADGGRTIDPRRGPARQRRGRLDPAA